MEHLATGGKPKKPIKREQLEIAEAQSELREILAQIETFTLKDDNWESWEKLWDRKRRLKAIMNGLNK